MEERYLKVGILGGSFDPIHQSHINIAKLLLREDLEWYSPSNQTSTPSTFQLDQIWLTPDYSPLLEKQFQGYEHRLNMMNLAIEPFNKIRLFDYKIKNQIVGGTLAFFEQLRSDKCFEGITFYFVMGTDCVKNFHEWADYQKLAATVPFVIVPRKGITLPYEENLMKEPHLWLADKTGQQVEGISSSKVRETLSQRGEIGKENQWISPQVYQYIQSHGLYRDSY